jgi:hypothetical protein
MVRQSDLLVRAAICGRLMDLTVDAKQRQRFKELRDAWIALAHDGPDLHGEAVAAFVECRDGSIH